MATTEKGLNTFHATFDKRLPHAPPDSFTNPVLNSNVNIVSAKLVVQETESKRKMDRSLRAFSLSIPYCIVIDSKLFIPSHRLQKDRFTLIQTKTNSQNQKDATAESNIRLLPSARPYEFNITFENGLRDLASLSLKPTYRVKISLSVGSTTISTVVIFLCTGPGPSLSSNHSVLQSWKDCMKSISNRSHCQQQAEKVGK